MQRSGRLLSARHNSRNGVKFPKLLCGRPSLYSSFHAAILRSLPAPRTNEQIPKPSVSFSQAANRAGIFRIFTPEDCAANGDTWDSSGDGFFGPGGGGQAVYNASGILYYGHSDHLGSIRLGSTTSRTSYFDTPYAPFGETYATFGGSNTDPAFTGQRQDTVSGLFDFPAREYSNEGRWHSPDPASLAAVDPTNPQSWNRYAYVLNSPAGGDPLANGTGIFTPEDCAANGGTWGASPNSFLAGGGISGLGIYGYGNPTPGCEVQYDDNGNFTGFKCDPQDSGGAGPLVARGNSSGPTMGR